MEELKLYEGRPADCTGRLEKEIRTYDLLDKLGIQFWRTDHGWMKADTMEDCHVIDACLNATVCKNLFLCNRQKDEFLSAHDARGTSPSKPKSFPISWALPA